MEMITIYREIKDPRREHLKEHSFECIFYIAVAAVIGGAKVGMMSPISASGMKIFPFKNPRFQECPFS